MRLIDGDELEETLGIKDRDLSALALLRDAQTVYAERIKRGKWIPWSGEDEGTYECSVCGETLTTLDGEHPISNGFKHCPYCGVKMLNEIPMQVDPTEAEKVIKSAECVSVMPSVSHGTWLEKTIHTAGEDGIEEWQSARCSVCGRYHTTPYAYYFSDYDYCPHCGARMDTK